MILVVGLGNIGQKYVETPHNVGFMVVERLAKLLGAGEWQEAGKTAAVVAKTRVGEIEVLLAKPTTMMNASGEAVGRLAQFYKIRPEDIWVVYDELDLPLGRVKIGSSGNDNGHNGLLSIAARLGHRRFWRFKMGVDVRQAREIPGLEYVLRPYDETDRGLLYRSVDMVAEAVKTALEQGLVAAQERYNKKYL